MSLLCSSCHPAINQFSTVHHSDSLREDFYKAFYFKPNTYTYFYKLLAQRYAYSLYKSTKTAQKNSHFSSKLQPCGIIMHFNINISCFLMHKKPHRLIPYLFSIKSLRVMNIKMWLKSQKDIDHV